MYSLILQNEWNRSVELTHNENLWQVTGISGLNTPAAIISTSAMTGFDGERFNSSRLDKRNIVISFVINGNVEANTMTLNSIIMPKRAITVYYKNRSSDLYIQGRVESFEYDKFSNQVAGQVSILCPNPCWMDKNATETLITPIIDLFEFPFAIPEEGIALSEIADARSGSIINKGNVECGIQIEIEAMESIVAPTIMNMTTQQKITVEEHIEAGHRIIINTTKGQKYVRKDCNCEESNIINKLQEDSTWIQLIPGENRFTYSALYGTENMRITINHRNLYGGV